jgi:hypothetical protein
MRSRPIIKYKLSAESRLPYIEVSIIPSMTQSSGTYGLDINSSGLCGPDIAAQGPLTHVINVILKVRRKAFIPRGVMTCYASTSCDLPRPWFRLPMLVDGCRLCKFLEKFPSGWYFRQHCTSLMLLVSIDITL